MAHLIKSRTRSEAWLKGSKYLIDNGNSTNLVLNIERPELGGKIERKARTLLDELYFKEREFPINTVAETIFPAWLYTHQGSKGVYTEYLKKYEIFKRSSDIRWGTYAYRMLYFEDRNGKVSNPLKSMIGKMSSVYNDERQKYKSCYEIDLTSDYYELPIYDNKKDRNRRYGGPCLMHLSFKLIGDTVHLTALYRSHDYRYKVLGNLLGLARLHYFVAAEVGTGLGELTIHSGYAFINDKGGKKPFAHIIDEVEQLDS